MDIDRSHLQTALGALHLQKGELSKARSEATKQDKKGPGVFYADFWKELLARTNDELERTEAAITAIQGVIGGS